MGLLPGPKRVLGGQKSINLFMTWVSQAEWKPVERAALVDDGRCATLRGHQQKTHRIHAGVHLYGPMQPPIGDRNEAIIGDLTLDIRGFNPRHKGI